MLTTTLMLLVAGVMLGVKVNGGSLSMLVIFRLAGFSVVSVKYLV